jgi:hypothetical protein
MVIYAFSFDTPFFLPLYPCNFLHDAFSLHVFYFSRCLSPICSLVFSLFTYPRSMYIVHLFSLETLVFTASHMSSVRQYIHNFRYLGLETTFDIYFSNIFPMLLALFTFL